MLYANYSKEILPFYLIKNYCFKLWVTFNSIHLWLELRRKRIISIVTRIDIVSRSRNYVPKLVDVVAGGKHTD